MNDLIKTILFDLEILVETTSSECAAGIWDNQEGRVQKFNEILKKLDKLGFQFESAPIDNVPGGDTGGWGVPSSAEREKLKEVSIKSQQLLAQLKSDMPVSEQAGRSREHFPTPPGTKWGEIKIRFVDGHRVSICVGAVKRVYNYTQMGMYNKKNGNPTVQWDLLQEFSRAYGMIDIPRKLDPQGAKRQKQKEKLAKELKHFFGIKVDPIQTLEDGKTWRTRFQIESDR